MLQCAAKSFPRFLSTMRLRHDGRTDRPPRWSVKATTAPEGRDLETQGAPIHMCEMLATLERAAFVESCGKFACKRKKTKKAGMFPSSTRR